jgi:hypothetical protein
MNSKDEIITSLQTAHAELEKAMAHLAQLPTFDPSHVQFTAHTLSNYLTVIGAGIDPLQLHLIDHPDEQTRRWLETLRHATALMTHTILQLMNAPVAGVVLGYARDSALLPEDLQQRELAPRVRKPLASFVFQGAWGKTTPLVTRQ